VPGNVEIWTGVAGPFDQFAVEYQAQGNLYWDNNGGYDYRFEPNPASSVLEGAMESAVIGPTVIAGVPSVLAETGQLEGVDTNGNLHVGVLVKNIGFEKQVGIVYTTNNWQTHQYASGKYLQSLPPASTPHQVNSESWQIVAPVGVGATGQYAALYTVEGTTYWDNNFGLNYSF
jgi:hypothetical protein